MHGRSLPRRARKALMVLAAACFSASSPAAEAGPRDAGPRATPPRLTEPRPLWSFHAGAPLSGPPGVGADGTLAVGTVDGYVHALHPDGVFRYSYTVSGRVLFSPVVLGDGLVLAASDKSRLYAIDTDGSLAWETTVAGGVLSPLVPDAVGRVWLRTGSGTAIAISRRGGVVGFAKIGRSMTLGPVLLAGGGVAVASPSELGLIGDFGQFRRRSVTPFLTGLRAVGSGFVGLREGSFTLFDAELGAVFSRDEVKALLCASPVVTLEAGAIRWLAPDGRLVAEARAPAGVAEPSACTPSSLFAVDGAGSVVQIRQSGETLRLHAASGTVVGLVPARPGALVVTYQDGRVVALKAVF